MNKKILALAALLVSSLFLAACKDEKITNITFVNQGSDTQPEYIESTLYDLDEENTSPNQDNRQMFLILHYTAVSKDETLALFKDPNSLPVVTILYPNYQPMVNLLCTVLCLMIKELGMLARVLGRPTAV